VCPLVFVVAPFIIIPVTKKEAQVVILVITSKRRSAFTVMAFLLICTFVVGTLAVNVASTWPSSPLLASRRNLSVELIHFVGASVADPPLNEPHQSLDGPVQFVIPRAGGGHALDVPTYGGECHNSLGKA